MIDFDAKLTKRETQVVELLFLGKSTKEIAHLMPERELSVKTVDYMIQVIKQKINAGKATEISLWWAVKRYGISIDWSALNKKLLSILLLCCISPEIVSPGDKLVRVTRTTAARTVSRTASRARKDTYYM